jgi:hypothetical protein
VVLAWTAHGGLQRLGNLVVAEAAFHRGGVFVSICVVVGGVGVVIVVIIAGRLIIW